MNHVSLVGTLKWVKVFEKIVMFSVETKGEVIFTAKCKSFEKGIIEQFKAGILHDGAPVWVSGYLKDEKYEKPGEPVKWSTSVFCSVIHGAGHYLGGQGAPSLTDSLKAEMKEPPADKNAIPDDDLPF